MRLWAGLWVGVLGQSARKRKKTMVGPDGLEPLTSTVSKRHTESNPCRLSLGNPQFLTDLPRATTLGPDLHHGLHSLLAIVRERFLLGFDFGRHEFLLPNRR
jgi:hypothetical protein